MSTTEESRAVFDKYWACMVAGDVDGMQAMCADDFRSWSPARGYIDKEATRKFTDWFRTLLVDGWFEFEDPIVTAEGDRVCFATESRAKLKNGNLYNNTYHFLQIIRDGKIVETREYNDPAHVMEVLKDEITAKRAEMAAQKA